MEDGRADLAFHCSAEGAQGDPSGIGRRRMHFLGVGSFSLEKLQPLILRALTLAGPHHLESSASARLPVTDFSPPSIDRRSPSRHSTPKISPAAPTAPTHLWPILSDGLRLRVTVQMFSTAPERPHGKTQRPRSNRVKRGRPHARPRSTLLKVEAPGVERGSGDCVGGCGSDPERTFWRRIGGLGRNLERVGARRKIPEDRARVAV